MCGIAGILGVDPARAIPAAERMRAALRHRGPDDEGLEVVRRGAGEPPAVLAHTRLSIVDLSPAGHQPMADQPPAERPRNWATYNGEIYNFRELVPELERLGWPCRTRTDTEVLLHGYRVWGVRAVERFAGMFAFCLLDTERGLAWLCRDRLGVKPLYVARPASGGLLFASEVRALLAAGPDLVPPRLRRAALESYLAQGAVMSERSIVEGVTMLPPGESLLVDFEGRLVRQVRYWSVAFGRDAGADVRPADASVPSDAEWLAAGSATPARFRVEVVSELALALRRAVKSQLYADVPVGLFLSSGVDSSSLAAMASEVASEPLRTLAVGFDVPAFDERAEARLTARELGTVHQELPLDGAEVLASFDAVLGAVNQPTVDGFNTYFVSRAARRAGLSVALSGLGGDELFGGYASFVDVPRALRVARIASLALDGSRARRAAFARGLVTLGTLAGRRPRSRALLKFSETLRRPAELLALYFLRRELFAPEARRALHALPRETEAWSGIEEDVLDTLREGHAGRAAPDQLAAFELGSYMRHMLLRDADVFSMAHALEVRVPLLEHYAVEEAARAQSRWRLPDPRPKPLLVDAAGPRLPARAFRSKKRGFTFPWRSWLAGPLAERSRAALSGSGLRDAGFDAGAVRAVWDRFSSGDPGTSPLEVLALVVLEAHLAKHGLSA